jgi:hypothetical protein
MVMAHATRTISIQRWYTRGMDAFLGIEISEKIVYFPRRGGLNGASDCSQHKADKSLLLLGTVIVPNVSLHASADYIQDCLCRKDDRCAPEHVKHCNTTH